MSTLLIEILLERSAKDLEMLRANIAFRLQQIKFLVLRLIPRLWYSYHLKFQNSKLKFEIQSKFEIPSKNPKFKIYEHAHTNFEL